MTEPDLEFRGRYIPSPDGSVVEGRRYRSSLMTPLLPQQMYAYTVLTPVAKESASGYRYQSFTNELPPMSLVAAIAGQQNRQPAPGTGPGGHAFPYKLKAVGFVNPWDAVYRQTALSQTTFEIVP